MEYLLVYLDYFYFVVIDHDHNIGDEIVEQKKNDFVRSVYTTLRSLDANNENNEHSFIEQTSPSTPQPMIIPELIVTESTSHTSNNNINNNNNEQ